ncbi:MAG: MarR family transcriptional regulator [Clostridiales bacterium]|nr:MarR family transcriptional regulator [Clostridiales bacterium]
MDKFDALKLENQLCFPLYAASRELIKKYKPYLDKLDLTYTQYIAMIVMWERGKINVKDLGERLFLDSGTLTPLLKSLEKKGFVTRSRDERDKRVLNVELTESGEKLKEKAIDIPYKVGGCARLDKQEREALRDILNKLLSD